MQHHWALAKDNPDRPYPHGVYSCAELRKQPEDRAIKLLAAQEGEAGRVGVKRSTVAREPSSGRNSPTPGPQTLVAGLQDFCEVCLPSVLLFPYHISINSLAIFTLLHAETTAAMKSWVWGCTDGFSNIHSNRRS